MLCKKFWPTILFHLPGIIERCSPVYAVFGGPHNLPQIPNSFPAISMAADVILGSKKLLWKCCIFDLLCCHWDNKETIGNLGLVVGSTKNCIYRATKRHLNIFDISNGLATRPLQRKVPYCFGTEDWNQSLPLKIFIQAPIGHATQQLAASLL